ncbi:MAG: hypothetical protein U5K00_04195 [Melioribacteraceae bacterium]|nr:hypothetical protein [Melioribacteraceae bacterium]
MLLRTGIVVSLIFLLFAGCQSEFERASTEVMMEDSEMRQEVMMHIMNDCNLYE